MDILFGKKKLQRDCSDNKARTISFGAERGKKIGLRLDQLRASTSLSVFITVHPRCHPLIGDRKGMWSADLDHPYRLLFEIADDPLPVDLHGNVDLSEVRKVRIIQIADTH